MVEKTTNFSPTKIKLIYSTMSFTTYNAHTFHAKVYNFFFSAFFSFFMFLTNNNHNKNFT